MKWIKHNIEDFKETSYADIDKAYRLAILEVAGKFRIRAYFLVMQSVFQREDKIQPVYLDVKEFKTKKEAIIYIRKLFGNFLEKEE